MAYCILNDLQLVFQLVIVSQKVKVQEVMDTALRLECAHVKVMLLEISVMHVQLDMKLGLIVMSAHLTITETRRANVLVCNFF